jgi:mannose-1-phosphate guanylyltransferase
VLDELARHAPDVLEAAERAFTLAKRLEGAGREQIELTEDVFGAAPDISIDYALLEKSSSVAVVPCDLGWSDVGNWDAMGTLHAPDTQGNTVSGRAMLHDAMGCHVESQERLAALVGVRDLVVVDTPDALLVADRRRAQDVKHIVARLKAEGGELYKLHKTVHRPWGTYTVLEDKPVYKIKCVVVHPGRSLSLQLHHHRSEHWVVVEGVAKVTNGDRELTLLPSQSTYIPAETQHRLENIGVVDLVLIEVQTGTYLGEDDIVRFEDRYGRV